MPNRSARSRPLASDSESRENADARTDLGARLLAERQAKGLSTRELARLTGVTASLISQVERGRVNPSVGTMYKLAEALGTTVDRFFAEAEVHEIAGAPRVDAVDLTDRRRLAAAEALASVGPLSDRIVRHADRHRITLAGGVQWELVYPSEAAGAEELEIISATYPPGTSSSSEPVRHHGVEYGVVMEGRLDLEVGGETVTLEPGDSISFNSMQPHRLSNSGSDVTQVMWVVRGRRPLQRTAT